MKLAYLVNTYPLPSHTFIRREIQALERQGWQIRRFAMRSGRAQLVDPADLQEDDATHHVLKAGGFSLIKGALSFAIKHPAAALSALRRAMRCGKSGAGDAPATGGRIKHLIYWLEAAEVARLCKAEGLRHIHAHFGTNSATIAMLAAQMGGISFSFTTHGPEEFDAPRAYSLDEKTRRAAFSVAISSFGRSQLFRWADYADWPRIEVVRCGVNPDTYPAALPLPEGPPHLIAIGRLVEQKGFPLLVEAMAQTAADLPDLHLTVLGDGPFRPLLEAQIARLGQQDRITLTGWLDEAGVRHHVGAAQALILPSFAEGLPLVLMEALASGRPAIACATTGVPELIDAETGWLVPAGDADMLAEAIRRFAATPRAQIQSMGLAGRDRVLTRHDINIEAAKLAALFAKQVEA